MDTLSHVLIGVSGGLDSLVLSHLFLKKGIEISWAHVNFGLRGDESEGDQEFLMQLAEQWDIPLDIKRFDSEKDILPGESIQMAARRFRYDYFQYLWEDKKVFTHLATGHHLDDKIENLFLKLSRGSNLHVLTGGTPLLPYLVRPLEDFSKEELKVYALKNRLVWREDSSNKKSDYERNALRNQILPQYYSLHPRVKKSLTESMAHLKKSQENLQYLYKKISGQCTLYLNEKKAEYDLTELIQFPFPEEVLQFLLPHFYDVEMKQIAQALGSKEPKFWQGKAGYLCLKEFHLSYRSHLNETPSFVWYQGEDFPKLPSFVQVNVSDIQRFNQEKLKFPIIIRPWKTGDYFYPEKGKGKKSVSDFLTDQKVSGFDKREVYVMQVDGKIAWIVGFRVSEFFVT